MPAVRARSVRRWCRRLRWQLRRSPVLWWLAALAAAAMTAATVDAGLSRAAATEARLGRLRQVPVVATSVAAGDAVPAGGVRMEWRPASQVPAGAIASHAGGRTAIVPLVPGEVVLASKLAPDGLRGAAALLPPGMRALAVPAGAGGRPPVELRDRVDVLATFGDVPTVVVAAGALVVAVDTEADTVTVAVHPDEAPAVAAAVASATVTLALTGP